MYVFDEMIDFGLKEGEEWPSKAHKKVAQLCLIQNPRIFTRDALMRNVEIINSLSERMIKKVTMNDLLDLGCDFI